MAGAHEAVFEGDVADGQRLEKGIGHDFCLQWSHELHSVLIYGAPLGFAEPRGQLIVGRRLRWLVWKPYHPANRK